ncbi:MAG: FAD-dependent oxidoreductase [Actinobacteria bacterium]|jgi:prolycopene isomerase|nr:MAG: FAD-dependent oxidoreductase [Actinomycetota bacterium]
MKDYDVVVIGAGLGGLSSAAFLAKAGKKVLLLERHYVPGGYASSFLRGRFEFEISLHELSGLGDEQNPGPLWKLLSEVDVTRRVDFLRIPEFYRCVLPDVDFVVPIGRENFEEAMCEYFPADAEGIREFTDVMFKFAQEALRANRVGMKMVTEHQEEFPTLLAYFGKSLQEVMDGFIKDERARTVLSVVCGYYCNPPSALSFMTYALGTVSYLRFGPWHVKGKSQALSQAFVDSIEDMGGEVWLRNGAQRILSEGGKVRGVVAQDGTEIICSTVVSNANPYATCLELIGREDTPDWYLRRLGAWSGGASTVNLYLGVDCPHEDLGLGHHETFYSDGYDVDGNWYKMKTGVSLEPSDIAVTAYNSVDPDFSPPGTSNLVCTFIAFSEPWMKLAPSEYADAKHRVAERALGLAENVAHGLRDHIEVIEVATPLTNIRYSRNVGGSIIGFDETFAGTGLVRMPATGPLQGLYFSGAWVNIGGGYEPSLYSGFLTSRKVLEDMEAGGAGPEAIAKLEKELEKQVEGMELPDSPTTRVEQALAGLHPDRVQLQVSEVIEDTASTRTLRMRAAEGELPWFRAGQYVNLFCEVEGVLTSRPYSIASAPGAGYWDITVRHMAGGFVSNYLLHEVKAGDRLESTGPSGSFYYEPLMDTGDLVFLAGGSGITPFASIIREAAGKGSGPEMHLIYGSRDPADIIFGEEMKKLEAKLPALKVDYVISEATQGWSGPCGLLDAQMISQLVGSVEGKTFYICGPPQMYLLCEGALASLGVPRRRIRREAYGPPADITSEPGWPGADPDAVFAVSEERTGRTFQARAGEPLMNSLERAGIVVEAVCRAGECTVCRTRLIAGKVFVPERVLARQVDAVAGYIHPCMSYPLEDLSIRI